jgi:predicted pyridoxine 5'-phosphate oxidase superfamily flavin-nucleotide-binding protein
MTIMFHDGNRQLQDRFDSRRISDRLEEKLTRTTFSPDDKVFIEGAGYFFLATADADGRPDCSFKGGPPGFVRVTGASELAFPDYDGNGMFKSLGNVVANPHVGLLFITMHDKPKRLRVNGIARISDRDPLRGGNRRSPTDRTCRGEGNLPQLPALYPEYADDRAVNLHASTKLRATGTGVEIIRQFQGCRSSAPANLQGLIASRNGRPGLCQPRRPC